MSRGVSLSTQKLETRIKPPNALVLHGRDDVSRAHRVQGRLPFRVRPECAQDCLLAVHGGSDAGGIEYVAGNDTEPFVRSRNLCRVPDCGSHAVTLRRACSTRHRPIPPVAPKTAIFIARAPARKPPQRLDVLPGSAARHLAAGADDIGKARITGAGRNGPRCILPSFLHGAPAPDRCCPEAPSAVPARPAPVQARPWSPRPRCRSRSRRSTAEAA